MPKATAKKAPTYKQKSKGLEPTTPAEKKLLALKKKLSSSVTKTLKAADVKIVRPAKLQAAGGGTTHWDNNWFDPVRWQDFDHADPEHSVGPLDFLPI